MARGIASAPANPYNEGMWQRWFAEEGYSKDEARRIFSDSVERVRQEISARAFSVARRSELLAKLRAKIGSGLEGLLMLRGDRYGDESLAQDAEHFRFFTGFSGSYGWAIFDFRAKKKSLLATDPRYRLQIGVECDSDLFEFSDSRQTEIADRLASMFSAGSRIGYDPWQFSQGLLEGVRARLRELAPMIRLVSIDADKISSLWHARPPAPLSLLSLRRASETGEEAFVRLRRMQEQMQTSAASNVESLLLTNSDACAWGLSLRASDVPYVPIALGYGLLTFARDSKDKTRACFFTRPRPTLRGEDLSHCEICTMGSLGGELDMLARAKRVLVLDKSKTPSALVRACRSRSLPLRFAEEPSAALRLCKTTRERANFRKAHLLDGIALVRFFSWLDRIGKSNERVDEAEAASKLYDFRLRSGKLLDESFKAISASGANGAQIHYPTPSAGSSLLRRDKPYLIDSGGQYAFGTTDITRTLVFGGGAGEVAFREAYTAVLRGHIALATAVFPEGTYAHSLDAFARRALWQRGLDYPHASGHGVGFCLSVHEGKVRFAQSGSGERLRLGMILSNEPGYYSPRNFGIRIENLMEVVYAGGMNSEKKRNLCFRTLSLAPISLTPIIIERLETWERRWLDAYHQRLRETIAPHLEDSHERAFLEHATKALVS